MLRRAVWYVYYEGFQEPADSLFWVSKMHYVTYRRTEEQHEQTAASSALV
jgi:hypothetical protein